MVQACVRSGGCVSDYLAACIAGVVGILVTLGTAVMLWNRHFLPIQAKQVALMVLQSIGSVIWLVATIFSQGLFQFQKGSVWENCSLWRVWIGSLLGFGLWISCHVARTYRLYYVFVARRLPPLHPYVVVAILLIPWLLFSLVTQLGDLVHHNISDTHCKYDTAWLVLNPIMVISYLLLLFWGEHRCKNVHFLFNEHQEIRLLARLVSVFFGVWVVLWVITRVTGNHDEVDVAKRFILLLGISITTLFLFYLSMWAPLKSLLVKDKTTPWQALQLPPKDSMPPPEGFEECCLETLLRYPDIMEAFKEFADRRFAGESVRFYDAVEKRSLLPQRDFTARVYAAENIIRNFIQQGAPLEINISSTMRSKILRSSDLGTEEVFKEARDECLRVFCQNFEKDFRHSATCQHLIRDLEAAFSNRHRFEQMGMKTDSSKHRNAGATRPLDLELGLQPKEPLAGEVPLLIDQGPLVPHSFTEAEGKAYLLRDPPEGASMWEATPGVVTGGEFDEGGGSAKVKRKKKKVGTPRGASPSGNDVELGMGVAGPVDTVQTSTGSPRPSPRPVGSSPRVGSLKSSPLKDKGPEGC